MSEPQQQGEPLGIVAGAGEYPSLMAAAAKRAGRRIVGVGFRGAVQADFIALCDEFRRFRVGAVDGPLAYFARHGVKEIVLTGQIKPACIYTMWPDAGARLIIGRIDRRNAHTIFGSTCDYCEQKGIRVLPSTVYMDDYMPAEGHIAGPAPTQEMLEEARRGMAMAREIARLDIGQSLVVQNGQARCVEGYKGTNECLMSARWDAAGEPPPAPILCKVTKQGHDMRFDVPCVGLGTLKTCLKAGVRAIALESKRTILLQREQVFAFAKEHGISLFALPCQPDSGQSKPEEHQFESDAAQARYLAQQLHGLGIGRSAVVCEGVVIAVEDVRGPLVCVKRAAAYMKRLRFARFTNWLCGLLLGRKSSPPAPMSMVYWGEPPAQLQDAARKARITLDSAPLNH